VKKFGDCKALRILFLTDHGFSAGGGAERYSRILSEELRKNQVSVITASVETQDSSEREKEQVKLRTVRGLVGRICDRRLLRGLESLKENLAIDIVHANILDQPHALAFMIACQRLKLPYVTTVHSYTHICPTEYFIKLPELIPCSNPYPNAHCIKCVSSKARINKGSLIQKNVLPYLRVPYNMWIFRTFLQRANFIISPSKQYSKLLFDLGITSLHLCHPLDINEIKPEPKGDGSVLFLGRLEWEKGIPVIIELAKQLPNVTIHVVGTGSMRQWLIENSTQNIIYHGYLSDEAKLDLMKNCSVVIVPSLWTEMFNLVVAEAFATAKPAISFNIGGPKEQIEASGAGLLATAFSIKDFTQKVRYFLQNKNLAQKMGLKGRLWVEQELNPTKYAQFIYSLYEKLNN